MMLQSFRNLSQREQLMLGGLAGFIFILLLIFMVVMPVLGFESQSIRRYGDASRLARMTADLDAPGVESADERALRTIVTELADRRKIIYTRINQTAEGGIQVDLESVPYATFFSWLQQLEREQDIVVTAAFVAPGETIDTIEGRITLLRAE